MIRNSIEAQGETLPIADCRMILPLDLMANSMRHFGRNIEAADEGRFNLAIGNRQ